MRDLDKLMRYATGNKSKAQQATLVKILSDYEVFEKKRALESQIAYLKEQYGETEVKNAV